VLVVGAITSRLAGRSRSSALSPGQAVRPASAAVRAYFGDLADGSKIDRWTVVRVFDLREGAIPVVLATPDGHRYQVDLLRRDPAGPKPVAETTQLGLFISNSGNGTQATPEEQGQGILALAAALTARENAGATPPSLMSMRERMSGVPGRHSAVPLGQ